MIQVDEPVGDATSSWNYCRKPTQEEINERKARFNK